MEKQEDAVFFSNLFEQKKTVETLIEESRVDADYYILLLFSTFIISLGLIFSNSIIMFAGMLITPMLSPVLSLGMGIATTSKEAISRAINTLLRSGIIAILVSFVVSFLTNQNSVSEHLLLASKPDIWLFLVAFFSGIVAAYSWTKQNISTNLPGVALAVSLIVPLCAIGVSFGISPISREVLSGAIVLFIVNLLGVIAAGTLVFVLFGFSHLQKWQDQKIKEEKETIERQKDALEGQN